MSKIKVGLLGGAFNPVHIGHLRLALEVLECTDLDRIELLPTYQPPHKGPGDLLDFKLRLELLEAAVQDFEQITVNPLESVLTPPSYTLNTLKYLIANQPEIKPYFILGCSDLLNLPFWHQGLELPLLSSFIVVDRSNDGLEEGQRFMRDTWKQCWLNHGRAYFPQQTTVSFIRIPRLDLSSSLIRQRWRQGKCLTFLLPDSVLDILRIRKSYVDKIWS